MAGARVGSDTLTGDPYTTLLDPTRTPTCTYCTVRGQDPPFKPLAVEGLGGVENLELRPAQRGVYVDAYDLLVALPSALPHGAARVFQPTVQVLAEGRGARI